MKIYNILYIHGMGGGEDSRIPSILNEHIGEYISPESDISIDIIVRTYDIDPDIAEKQIAAWRQELNPELVIGESLGSLHAIRIDGVPHLFVSPATGAARWMALASYLPGAAWFMRTKFQPRPGKRQPLDFTRDILRHYRGMRGKVLTHSPSRGGKDYFLPSSAQRTPIAVGVLSMSEAGASISDETLTPYIKVRIIWKRNSSTQC